MVALPDFDGTTWNPDPDPRSRTLVDDPRDRERARRPRSCRSSQLDALFRTTGDLDLPWLPMPYPASTTDLDADGLAWDPEAGAITLTTRVDTGTSYSITPQSVLPTAGELRAQPPADAARWRATSPTPTTCRTRSKNSPGDGRKAPTTTSTTRSWPSRIASPTARSSSTTTPCSRVTTRTPCSTSSRESKAGFCQQFASSMAVMLRTLGIPSRVAVGFTAGSFDDERGVRRVTTDQAHAWVEVFFPDLRVAHVRSTPSRTDTFAYPYLDPRRLGSMLGSPLHDPDGPGRPNVTGAANGDVNTTILQLKEQGRCLGFQPRPAPSAAGTVRTARRVGPLPAGLAGPGDPAPRDRSSR